MKSIMSIILVMLVFTGLFAEDKLSAKLERARKQREYMENRWQYNSQYYNALYHVSKRQWDRAMYSVQKMLEVFPGNKQGEELVQMIEKRRWEYFEKGEEKALIIERTMEKGFDWSTIDTFGEEIARIYSDGRKHFLLGEEQYRAGNKEKAETYYRMAISRSPAFAGAYTRLGELYYLKDEYDLAVYAFEKAAELYPEGQEARILLGNAFLLAKDYKNAELVLKETVVANPKTEVAALARGLLNRLNRENRILELMSKQKIKDEKYIYLTQKQEGELSDYAYAHYYFLRRARAVNPDYWLIHYLISYSYRTTYKKKDAVASIDRALKRAPKVYTDFLNRVKDEFTSEDLKPFQYDAVEFHLSRARMLYENKHYPEAIGEAVIALSLNPSSPEAHLIMGKCFTETNSFNRAIAEYRKAVSLSPRLFDGYYLMGKEYMRTHQYEEAVDAFKKAAFIDRNRYEVYEALGEVYMNVDDHLSALEAFRKTVQLKPDVPRAYLNIGVIYTEQGEYERAQENFTAAINYQKNYVDAYANMGIVYYRMWERDRVEEYLDKAISYTEDALSFDPENAIMKEYLGFYKSKK